MSCLQDNVERRPAFDGHEQETPAVPLLDDASREGDVILGRIAALFRRRRLDDEFDEELPAWRAGSVNPVLALRGE